MRVLETMVRVWQRVPRSLRKSVLVVPGVRSLGDNLYPDQLDVFPLAKPLEGHRMRLHWKSRKAWVFGTYEPDVAAVIQELVQPGQLALDIGANIGYFTLLLAKQVGPSGSVIAFEPFSKAFETLKENVEMNGYRNVVFENKAVAERTGPVSLSQDDSNPLSYTESIVLGHGINVPAVALDEYFASTARRVDFVKIDVEGAEARVLEGMSGILERDVPTMVVELHDFANSVRSHPALRRLRKAPYAVTFLDKPHHTVHALARPARLATNTLF